MKIEPGYWRCRNGSRARVLCTDAPGDYPVVGYVEYEKGACATIKWRTDGQYLDDAEVCVHDHDIIEPWRDESDAELVDQLRDLLHQMASRNIKVDVDFLRDEAAKQPVRVSGWVPISVRGTLVNRLFDTKDEALDWLDLTFTDIHQFVVVYVTGTEGVGPQTNSGVGPDGEDNS